VKNVTTAHIKYKDVMERYVGRLFVSQLSLNASDLS